MKPGQRLLFLIGTAGATLLLMFVAGVAGPLGLFLNLLLPLPVAYLVMRRDLATGCGAVVLVCLGLWGGGGLAAVGSYLLQFGFGSLLLPGLLRRGVGWNRSVALSVLTVVAVSAAVTSGYAVWQGTSLHGLVDGYVKSQLDQAMEIYRSANLPAEQLKEFRSLAEGTGAFLLRAYPALAVVVTGVLQLLTLLLLSALSRGGYQIPGPEFRLWRANEWLIWPLIAGGFGLTFGTGLVQTVALNVVTVLLPVYFLQGLAVVSFYFARRGISPLFRAIGYLLLTIFNPLPLIVTGIGVFDLWADFRKPRIKKT